MKTILSLIFTALLSFGVSAQSKTITSDVKFNSVVVLQDLQGDVQIQSWDKQTIQITSEDGTVLKVYKTDEAVFISPVNGKESNSTKYIVYLPKTVKLDWFSTDANLSIKGELAALKLENETGNLPLADICSAFQFSELTQFSSTL